MISSERAATRLPPLVPDDRAAAGAAGVRLSEVLAGLSRALDLTEGQRAGHTVRSCAIGMRISDELGLPAVERSALYYTLLLKDAGCSSNAARMAALYGTDDQDAKFRMKFADWDRRIPLAVQAFRTAGKGRGIGAHVRYFLRLARTPDVTRALITVRCERGADVVRRLGFPDATVEGVRSLDEHWNGCGYPAGLRGEEIPLLARIANLAQTLEIFFSSRGGPSAALRVARARRETWFDPHLVDLVGRWKSDAAWWNRLADPALEAEVAASEPVPAAEDGPRTLDDDGLDAVAEAFAGIVDAKSPHTFRHSTRVALYAARVAGVLGLGADEERRIRRAGLLHDVGKLGISNLILDKNGPLTPDERAQVELHPGFGWEILHRVGAFSSFARTAVVHHEKLDGSGYPWRLTAEQLDLPDRILAVADVYEALTADRPYRAGMAPDVAMSILRREVSAGFLDGRAVDALAAVTLDETGGA